MKTNKIQLNKKALIKATSGILSFVLTANAGLNLLTADLFAASSGSVRIGEVEISAEPGSVFYIVDSDGTPMLSTSQTDLDSAQAISQYASCEINDCTLSILTDYKLDVVTLSGSSDDPDTNGKLIINSGCSVDIYDRVTGKKSNIYNYGSLEMNDYVVFNGDCAIYNYGSLNYWGSWDGEGNNSIYNYGTFETFSLYSSELGEYHITKFYNGENGKIIATNVDITDGYDYTDEAGSEIHIEYNLEKDSRNLNAVVFADPGAYIRSDGGTFTLQCGDSTRKTISGATETSVDDLYDDPKLSLATVPDVFAGQDYDFSSLISIGSSYDGEVYLEYKRYYDDSNTFSTEKPMTAGRCEVRAVVTGKGTFRKAYSEIRTYEIKNLSYTEVIKDGKYCTLSGIVNGKYIPNELIVTPPEGYKITSSHDRESYDENNNRVFLDYLSFSKEEIEVAPGFMNQDVMVAFQRESDGYITESVAIYSVIPKDAEGNTAWSKLIFDTEAPKISAFKGSENVTEVSIEEENAAVTADELSVRVTDKINLESVVVSVDGVETDYSDKIIEQTVLGVDGDDSASTIYTATIALSSTPGKAKQITITATDGAGNVSTAEFKLLPESRIDPEFDATLPETIHVGEEYEPEVTTNSDSPIYYGYYSYDEEAYLEEAPTEAGSYRMSVSVRATDLFNAASVSLDYEILRYDLEVELTVNDINVGGTVNPVLTGVPEDYDGTIIYEYKLTTEPEDNYSTTKPTAFGGYTVRVTLPETYIYSGAEVSDTFAISRNALTATVSVDDLYVGDEITPEVTTDPEDYDGDITYEYKLNTEEDDAYSEDEPTAAGTYTVRATLAATDVYLGTSCTDEFTISKNDISAVVNVESIYVGDTVTPLMADVPVDYDGTIKYEYKLSTAEDSAYSTTVPTSAGTYKVRATLPETDKYLSFTCENTFRIYLNSLNSGAIIDDIYVGETPNPVLLHIPDDYDGNLDDVVYEYKLEEENDDAYSTTVPTAAGSYYARIYIPQTAKYEDNEIITSFNIYKRPAEATVSVPDITIGGTISPVVTTESDGKASTTFMYKLSTEPEDLYSDVIPTAAGTYTIMAIVPETDTYESTSCTSEFTILKKTLTAEVTVADINVGGTVTPVVTTDPEDYNGTITYEYKLSTDTEYSSTVPTAAGEYTVKATLAETDTCLGTSCTGTFTISKNALTATVSVDDIYVGSTPSPVVTKPADYNGTITYEYKLSTDTEYSSTVPTAAGTYTVRATLAATDVYLGTTCTTTFKINKIETSATVSVEDIHVGEEIYPELTIVPEDFDGTITYEFKGSNDEAFTTDVPTAAGAYTVRVTLSESDTYLGTTCTDTFAISRNALTATVSVEDFNVGSTPAPVVTVPEDYNGAITYEYKLSTATEYSSTVPTAAGTYTVRANFAATDIYLSTTATSTFTISKNDLTATVSVEDFNVGETPAPVVTTDPADYNGAITYEYKSSTDEAFSSTIPTAAGTYTVRANLATTDKYLSTTATSTFTISKNELTATVSVADFNVGGTPAPVVTAPADYNGAITYEYKLTTAENYSSAVPTAAGTYDVRATLAETAKYLSTTATSTFTINKNTLTATVSVANINVGGTVTPVVTAPADYNGTITYEYKLSTDEEYSSTVPTAAGTYNVRATLDETAIYLATSCTGTFTISKNALTATVSVADINVGTTPAPVVTTDPADYNGTITYEYKLSTAAEYSSAVPTTAGTYTVRATLAATDVYLGTTATSTFKINKNAATATVSADDIYVGETVNPLVSSISGGTYTLEYKNNFAPDTAYSTVKPTAAGTYTVRATIVETATYLSTTCTDTFTIYKNALTATVSVDDIKVGETPDPAVTTSAADYNGTITYEYKKTTDTEYTSSVPTAAGTYNVRAVVGETAKYLGTTATSTFTIDKNETTATVSVANITVGNDPEPIVITVSDGKYLATFQYKAAGADDTTYSDTVPTAAGSYTVKASIPETAKYFATTATATFTISKNVATSSVDVEDILVGGTIYADVTTNSDGAQTVEYKAADADDSAYSTTLPYVEGKYTVRVTIPETAKYFATSCTSDFFISKNETDASVSVESIYVGGNVVPVISTDSNGKEDTTYEYKVAGADDSTYTATVPSAAGKYTVRATVPATLEYTKIVCYNSFEIYLNPVTMQTFRVANYFVGQSPDVEFECSSNGDVTFEYKPKNANDIEYTTDAPTKPGIYTARASVAETYFYASATFITDFTVSYLNAPQTTFTPAGTEGKNGYFKSDVELTAPAGYLISATEDGVYTKSIPYTEDLDTFYLKRDDGATTSSIVITDKPKIDKDAPEFKPSTAVTPNAVMFTPSITIKVDDQNLKSLTVNGVPVDLTTITDNTLTLSPGMGVLEVNIVAEDIAGNVSKISFILKAEWLELGTIPADQLVPLDVETEYNLGTGKWQVIKGNPEDNTVKPEADPTIYNGELPVYVNENGDYTVTQVS